MLPPQPGAGVGRGVGGRGRWAACATHHGLKSTSDRGEDTTTASCGAIMAAAGVTCTLPGEARVRTSLYVHTRTLARAY